MTAPSYRIGTFHGFPGIECRVCGAVSYHKQDIAERYCARCHVFHDDRARLRQYRSILSQLTPEERARVLADPGEDEAAGDPGAVDEGDRR